jgi:cytochrome c-type biogenesis protein CcmH
MTLWFGLALMTAAAVLAVLWPLARREWKLQSGSDVAVYRDQLEEIERDRAAGLIGDKEAAAARVEVSRRLIAAADRPMPAGAPASATRRRRALATAAFVVLPFGAALFYLALGSPSLPDHPLAQRLAAARGGGSLAALIAQAETHLDRNSEDGRGWEVIAPIYLRLGRFADAVRARRNALRLNGETPERESALGEAMVFAANGVVTAEAKAAFEKAVALDGGDVQARYFLGLAAEQDGDHAHAAAIWRELIESAPRDAPWRDALRSELARVEAGAAPPSSGAGPSIAPSEEQIAAVSELSVDQRNVVIRGMVERLSERLHDDGSDVEGWVRLIRSYLVLGEPSKARAAALDARRALASDPTKLQRVDELVRGLGLKADGSETAR